MSVFEVTAAGVRADLDYIQKKIDLCFRTMSPVQALVATYNMRRQRMLMKRTARAARIL